jgi:hypothetical protein
LLIRRQRQMCIRDRKINRVEDKVPPEVAKRAGTGGLPAHLAPAIRLPE